MIRIIHVSDLHFGRTRDDATKNSSQLLAKIHQTYDFSNAANTYLMCTGDFVNGEEAFTVHDEWQNVAQALEMFRTKLFATPGNHDQEIETGMLNSYNDMCRQVDLPTQCAVGGTLTDGATTIALLGVDSTWWSPIFGIVGVGKIDEREQRAVDAFANLQSPGWKLLYLHHRPVEPSLWDRLKWNVLHLLRKDRRDGDLQEAFLGLMNADRFLKSIAGKVDLLLFGHDKDFATDFDGHQHPYWINANREDTRNVGWFELTFEGNTCELQVYGPDGSAQSPKKTLPKT